jgi:hypothetical protein
LTVSFGLLAGIVVMILSSSSRPTLVVFATHARQPASRCEPVDGRRAPGDLEHEEDAKAQRIYTSCVMSSYRQSTPSLLAT